MSNKFRKYRRTNVAEMRPYVEGEQLDGRVSISEADRENGSPNPGDMIARNPANHADQWLVAADYFAANFEPYDEATTDTHAEIERLKDAVQERDGVIEVILLRELRLREALEGVLNCPQMSDAELLGPWGCPESAAAEAKARAALAGKE